ncbi:unnamed protein product [Gemmata massiliana]|uniref:Uncharacterized protein n=1 Tax=Gemmata massiliana TaxID=1210884 RepID=A0A6P2CUT2_9BACT|nr:unnamed protein product [Gemmata massiliana]
MSLGRRPKEPDGMVLRSYQNTFRSGTSSTLFSGRSEGESYFLPYQIITGTSLYDIPVR